MEKVIVYSNPTSPAVEDYRILCANVLSLQRDKKVIEVAGVTNENSANLVVANLAVAIAQTGQRILLVDCNLRNPQLHDIFGLQNQGLTDCLISVQDYQSFIKETAQQNLYLLTAGTMPSNPVKTLLSQPMEALLKTMREDYDIVLLALPAIGVVADAVVIGSQTDGAIIIVKNKEDKVANVQIAKDNLLKAGVFIYGCILN